MKSKAVFTAGIIAAFGLAVMTSSAVYAQSQGNDRGLNTIVQKIAKKFNLKESDVKAVFEQERLERQKEKTKSFETYLSGLVAKGELTNDQKTLILEKRQELLKNRSQNKENWQTKKKEIQDWAKQNNIPLKYMMFHRGKMH